MSNDNLVKVVLSLMLENSNQDESDYERLLRSARQSSTSLSKETPTVPIDYLPEDLAAILVDKNGERGKEWDILGFDTGEDTRYPITLDGQTVKAQQGQYLSGEPYVDIMSDDWTEVVRTVPRDRLERKAVTVTSWYAVVTGNAVMVEHWLKDRGYDRASAGSPSYVAVRPATDEEISSIQGVDY